MPAGHGSVTVGASAPPGRERDRPAHRSRCRRGRRRPWPASPRAVRGRWPSAAPARRARTPGRRRPTAPAVMATPAAAVALDLTIAPFAVAAAALPVSSVKRDDHQRHRHEDRRGLARVLQRGAEVAAVAATGHVAVGGRRRAPARVVRLEQVQAHGLAVARAGLALLDEVDARAVDEVLRRLRADAELVGEGGVRDPVDLPAQQRVALLRPADRRGRRAGRGPCRDSRPTCSGSVAAGARRTPAVLGVVEVHAVGPHARELVERAVAGQPEQPRLQLDVAVVAPQRAARAQHRPPARRPRRARSCGRAPCRA